MSKIIKGSFTIDHVSKEKLRESKIKHAMHMFRKRFDYQLSISELEEITELTKSQNAELVMWQKGHCSVFKLSWKSFQFFAVYGHDLDCIVTFLTLNMDPKVFED